jgi:alkaline phosphatase D
LKTWLVISLISLFISPAIAQKELPSVDSLPPNLYLDSAFAPFLFGVTSGDPLTDRVIIWTRISPNLNENSIQVRWEIALDPLFNNLINSGGTEATATKDWTVKVDADGLQAGTYYYYRFISPDGKYSRVGRTKTAPTSGATHFRMASLSCSSIYSGYFNAYKRLGERNDIDVVVHLGDYIYDFVDGSEEIRVPSPYPIEPNDLATFRERHRYYLTDPDLRLARQQQTWIAIWDNHDIEVRHPEIDKQAKQAFFEYLPIREVSLEEPYRIYRQFSFGGLCDIFLLDMDSYVIEEGQDRTFLGQTQLQWLKKNVTESTAKWKIIGSQKMIGGWYSKGIPKFLGLPGDGTFFDTSSFDGYHEERDALLQFFADSAINNLVVVSGDMHMTFAMNLSPNPHNRKLYKRHTGRGSVGVEVLTTSISRGNFDEAGAPKPAVELIRKVSMRTNPHHVFTDFIQHGYGILDVTSERIIVEMWYSPVLYQTTKENFGVGLRVRDGKNKWDWRLLAEPAKTKQ